VVCSMCAECCKYLVFDVKKDLMSARKLTQENIVYITIPGLLSEDSRRYYSLRGVAIRDKKKETVLVFENKYKSENIIEKINRNKYKLIFKVVCVMLEDNKCKIWNTRPNICHYDKCELDVWFPPSCTDREKYKKEE